MADPFPHQGWRVPQRTPAIAAIGTLATVVIPLLIAGWIYNTRLRPTRVQPVSTFPAPGVETFIHDGSQDPERDARRRRADPDIAAAKRRVIQEGLAGWPR